MSIDYAALATTAQELIDELGRTITIIRFDQDPDDADEPWNGAANPRGTPDASLTTGAVFVEPSSATKLGMRAIPEDILKRLSAIAIVAPGPTNTFDLATANEIIDGSLRQKVLIVDTLKPAAVALLYFLGVAA